MDLIDEKMRTTMRIVIIHHVNDVVSTEPQIVKRDVKGSKDNKMFPNIKIQTNKMFPNTTN